MPVRYIEEDLQTAALYHWEVAADRVGEKRHNTRSPFVPRKLLWKSK